MEGLRLDFNLWKRESGFDCQAADFSLFSNAERDEGRVKLFEGVCLSAFSESEAS